MNSHGNGFISIICGGIFSLSSVILDNSMTHDIEQLIKAVFFGFIGGIVGYFGKLFAMFVHKKLRR